MNAEKGVKSDMALEAKYTENFPTSIYNPLRALPFDHQAIENTISQAERYSRGFAGGVTFYTNDMEFATTYTGLFNARGITNFRFVVVPATRGQQDMISQDGFSDRPLPPNIIQYDHTNPSPYFTDDQIAYIESIQKYFSQEDLRRIRKLECFRRNINVTGMGESSIPGLRFKPGIGNLYVKRFSSEKYRKMIDTFLDYVPKDFPGDDVYKCNMPPFRINVPNGDRYYPYTFHGDLHHWRKRLFEAAEHYRTLIGYFNQGKFCLSNGQSFPFSEIAVDCVQTRTYPRGW